MGSRDSTGQQEADEGTLSRDVLSRAGRRCEVNCLKCNRKIRKGTLATVGESIDLGPKTEVEIKIVCPRCDVTIYTFVDETRFAREDHAALLVTKRRTKK
jgi:hypothetical protein